MTIQEELSLHTDKVVGRLGADAAAILFGGQIDEARLVVQGALGKGQRARIFELPDANAELVSLVSRLKAGPVILTFYRGGWCPYCNIALRALQAHLPEIRRRGGILMAISPEVPDHSLSTRERLVLDFDVLSDQDNVVARRYGLVYRVSDLAREQLVVLGRDLVARNGSDSWELPITATYVIDTTGTIVFAHVDADYRNRLDPALIVENLSIG